jgi:haloacetate dehalogenase
LDLWERVGFDFAINAYHWFMFAQPHPLPEQLLAGSHAFFINWTLERMAQGLHRLHPVALDEYRRCFARPEVRAAMVADYRAAATLDADHERDDRWRGRKLTCPVHIVWDADRPQSSPTPLDTWRNWSDRLTGCPVPGGHLMLETNPLGLLDAIDQFLLRHATKD